MQLDPQYIGKLLHDRGFKDWTLYMFRQVEGQKFIVEEKHEEIFEMFQGAYDLLSKRGILNVPPRAGKSTLAIYFVAYCLAKDLKCEFIYTSFNQSLLGELSLRLRGIMESVQYKSMYPEDIYEEDVKTVYADDYWKKFHDRQSKETRVSYSNKKIKTASGGVVLFASIGSQITGMGAGRRGIKDRFTGCIIIDDPNKPSDIHSKVMRDKVMTYYQETLISRTNESHTAIIVIQQRLHLQDLTGFLLKKYKFDLLKIPLIDKTGVCNFQSQYDEEKISELKESEFAFSSQYQQEPIMLGGKFGLPVYHTGESKDIHHGICHVDASFDGADYTSLTILKQVGDGFIGYGKLYKQHIDDVKADIVADVNRFLGGTIYLETNADKGYVAKSLNDLKCMTSEYHESQNKHVKIMLYAKDSWKKTKWIQETDSEYLEQCVEYTEKSEHDDAIDSYSSLIRIYKEEYRSWKGLVD